MTASVLMTFIPTPLVYQAVQQMPIRRQRVPNFELTPLPVFPGKGKLHIPICAIKQLYYPRI